MRLPESLFATEQERLKELSLLEVLCHGGVTRHARAAQSWSVWDQPGIRGIRANDRFIHFKAA